MDRGKRNPVSIEGAARVIYEESQILIQLQYGMGWRDWSGLDQKVRQHWIDIATIASEIDWDGFEGKRVVNKLWASAALDWIRARGWDWREGRD